MTHPWRELVLLTCLTAAGFALRLAALNSESIWLDEAFSFEMAQHSADDLWNGEPLDPGNPPLYYILLHYWLGVFGQTIEAARAMSGVAGALTIPATWLLAQLCGGHVAVRILSALLVTVSPSLVYLGRETRTYTVFALVVTLAACAAEAIAQSNAASPKRLAIGPWIAFTLLASTFCYFHYYGFLLLPLFGLYLLVRLFPSWPRIAVLVLSFAVIAGAFLPWLPTFKEQIALGTTRGGSTWMMHLAVTPLYSLAGHTLVWKEDGMALVGGFTAIALGLIYGPVLYWSWRARQLPVLPLFLSVGLVTMAIAISVLKSPMLQSRYLSAIFPCLMIVLASGLVAGYRLWPSGARISAWSLAGLMTASLTLIYAQHHKEDWRPIAGMIATKGPSLPVYCYEDVSKLSLQYYIPWVKIHSIDPVATSFSPDGEPWVKSGLLEKMESEPNGCWFVLYLSLPETMPELDAIDEWILNHFIVSVEYGDKVADPTFPFIHIYRIEPKSSRPAASVK